MLKYVSMDLHVLGLEFRVVTIAITTRHNLTNLN